MQKNDELTPDEIKELERIMAEPDVILTTEQLQMLAGTYRFKECRCGMTICAVCGGCHNLHCDHWCVVGIECRELMDFLSTYRIATKPSQFQEKNRM